MLGEIEKNRPNLDITQLPGQTDLALELWYEKGAFESGAGLTRELGQLLDELAPSINDWDQDHRDAALSLVEALADRPETLPLLSSEHQLVIGKSYINVVGKLQPEDDWLGPPWTVLELGQQIADILGKETDFAHGMRLRGELAEAWSNYAARVSFDESSKPFKEKALFDQSFRQKLNDLQNVFLSKDPEAVANEIQRNGPNDLTPAAREITVWYGQHTRQGASAKLPILRSAPGYIKQLGQKNVDIAKFWNISDIDQAQKVVEAIMADQRTASLFESRFKAKTGNEFNETTEAEKRALADLNLNLARNVYAELYARRTGYEQVSQRIMEQVDQANQMENPRKKLKPILKWIQQVYPEFSDYDPAAIRQFIETHQAELNAAHEQKQSGVAETLQRLEAVMPASANFVRFMDRSLFDLKSANLTTDCTAWNLHTGFNAWTVPVWVTNPSFNFAYIYAGNTIAAKMGMILAFDKDNIPQVIIDSIETNKNLAKEDDTIALEAIYAGFSELQNWADKNGFGTLQVCTFTNSQELTANLPIINGGKNDLGLTYDGLVATEELLNALGVNAEQLPPIYLQSDATEFDEEGEAVAHGEYVEGAEVFEAMANLALNKADGSNSLVNRETLLEALRSGDRDLIADGLIAALVPEFAEAFIAPIECDALNNLYENCRAEAGIRRESLEGVLKSTLAALLDDTKREEIEDRHRGEAQEDVDYSFYDDDEAYERYVEELRQKKLMQDAEDERDRLYQKTKHEEAEQIKSDLVPSSLIVDDQDALEGLIENWGTARPKYLHIMDILEGLFGSELSNEVLDIVKAARYVFGVVRPLGEVPEPEMKEVREETIIPLQNMPLYDRRKMISI